MDTQQEHLDNLQAIRRLMEQSSRFAGLSGLAGVIAGSLALAAVASVYAYLGISPLSPQAYPLPTPANPAELSAYNNFLAIIFGLVLLLSLCAGILMAYLKARKLGLPVWDGTAQRLAAHFFLPLAAGGIYILLLMYHGYFLLVIPATLLFYGMAHLNASKFTIPHIRFLGMAEIITGLLATCFISHSLLFWAWGFGVLHILYGAFIYFKYER